MFYKQDFTLINIANIPNSQNKLDILLELLNGKEWTINEICEGFIPNKYGCKSSTMRKVINHCAIIGILDKRENFYFLSDLSIAYISRQIDLEYYARKLIRKNENLEKVYDIIAQLLMIFDNEMSFRCLYSIFSLVSQRRVDTSAVSSCGRNLRSFFSLFIMAGLVEKTSTRFRLVKYGIEDKIGLSYCFDEIVIKTKQIYNYICNFFDGKVTESIMRCVTTYENDKYIWVKSSLYKNSGEIKNLNNEYIGTLIIKEKRNG